MTHAPLWTAKTAAQATGGRATGTWSATGVSIDSRTLDPGDLFVALKGPNFDGHRFVADALAKGAAGAVVSEIPEGVNPDALVVVENTDTALEDLGRTARRASGALVIGVTGSVGKTGTKEALTACLSEQGTTHAAVGSFNNHWGVPLTLARLPADADFAVIEMGMNHAGELATLTDQVRPDVAVITTVQAAHIENFASVGHIAEAKAEILQGVPGDGTAILPRDNPHYPLLHARAHAAGIGNIHGFGQHRQAEIRRIASEVDTTHSEVSAEILGQRLDFTVGLAGAHWVDNALAVLGAVAAVGADLDAAAKVLARLTPPARRGERHRLSIPGGTFELIDDSYNANPSSMRAALAVLGAARDGRRIAALGDMKELGEDSPRYHAALADPVEAADVALVFTCGAEMAALARNLPASRRGGHAATAAELAPLLADALQPGDTVLVKGSAGARMGEVVTYLTDAAAARATDAGKAANDG
jgi:UDP-N-acetylmuramoyl-tripeptide--D-alanyl-D-alanine ligase